MSQQPRRICPTCGQPELAELLDEVEDSVDAFFDDLGSQPLRIELDEEEEGSTSIAIPSGTVAELEATLSGIAHALNVLRGSTLDCPEDLQNLLDALARDASSWSRRLAGLRGCHAGGSQSAI